MEQTLMQIFQNCSDVVFRRVTIDERARPAGPTQVDDPAASAATPRTRDLLIVYVDGLLDFRHLDDMVLKPLLFDEPRHDAATNPAEWLQMCAVPVGETRVVGTLSEAVRRILAGDAGMFIQGSDRAVMASIRGWEKRTIEEPNSEQVIRGPREGFVETLRVNTSLVRRRIRSPKLKVEALSLGTLTNTDVAILYIEGVADETVVEEVRQRVRDIQIDGVLETGYIEEFIEDCWWSPFPTLMDTERPDIVAAQLLEGRVAILVDGTPYALVAPMTFWMGLQANEDYYARAMIATAIRWLRLCFGFIALFLPSFYVALVSFQQEMVPTTFLLNVAASQEATPFPAVVEAFMMEFMFETLREAGVRLPRAVGSAISIVGALVIGQAAVQAGIVSAPMVIVVATTGIASFTIPRFAVGIAIRLLRFPLLFLAGTLGFFGITIGLIAILIHLSMLRSFGVPYFEPLAPMQGWHLRDVLIRAPRWALWKRPQTATDGNRVRLKPGQKPSPPN
ncbi:spore germination protein [Alicyclobacillus macrosporangiidus]|uniref:spore germination protein n=1 Tax=Alicyclobacillus macrosporangiidus TaxID=392015 RepID=UPI00068A38BB